MEDFNIPCPERIALLERLQDAMGGAPPYFWAACQVCDLKALGRLVEHARIYPAAARIIAGQCRSMSQYCKQDSLNIPFILFATILPLLSLANTFIGSAHPGGLSQPSTPKKRTPVPSSDLGSSPAISGPPAKKQKTSDSPASKVASSPVLSRNKIIRTSAEQRDEFCCVLTRDADIQLAHIYPFHSIKHKEEDIFGARHMFWDLLKNFWPEEKVAAWQAELFPEGINKIGLERVSNLITLCPNAHTIWDRGAFALKPISVSNDNTTLKLQFFWQKRQQDTQGTMSLLTIPFSTEHLDQNEGAYDHGNTLLFNLHTRKPITSGEFFELQTDDPDTIPLPSFKLLEMQWFLQRIAGMAGAAGLDNSDWEEDSDEENSNLGLDEVGDTSLISRDPSLPSSPQFLGKNNLGSKHHTEEAAEDGVRVREIM
jgi:HNH endonuclease